MIFRGETLDTTSVPGTVQIDVGTPASLIWAPSAGNSKWSVNSDKNWNNSGTQDVFYQMDTVTFDDTGVGVNGGTVTLVGNLAPSGTAGYASSAVPPTTTAVTVNVSAPNSYTFTGTGSIVGATSLSMSGGGTLNIANKNSFGGIDPSGNPYGVVSIHQGTINVLPGGILTNNTTEIDVGDTPGQTGTLSMSSGTALVPLGANGNSGVNVGINGGAGILTMTGNSLLDATCYNPFYNVIAIGYNNGATGTSGTATVGGTSTLRAANGQIQVGFGGTGVLTIQDQATVATGTFDLGTSGGTGTLYLNGGTLSVPGVTNDNTAGSTGTIYFNGGTLQANAASGNFISAGGTNATMTAYVQKGGAVIDSNGFNLTLGQSLLHDPSLGNTVDGGLKKAGAGNLLLTGSNTYTGATNITGGVLTLAPNQPAQLLYRLDASNTASLTINGSGYVTQVNDLSGNGNNFVNPSSTVTVVNGGSGFNNLNVLNFSYNNGSADPNNTLVLKKSTNPQTVFIVEQVNGSHTGDDNMFGSTGNDQDIRVGPAGTNQIYNPGNNNDFTNGGGGKMYINGVLQPGNVAAGSPQLLEAYAGALTASPAPWSSTSLSNVTFDSRAFDGYIGEVMVYNAPLTDAARQQVEAYLTGEWLGGTPASLPPSYFAQSVSTALPDTDVNMSAGTTLDLNDNIVTIGALNGPATAQVLLGSGTNGTARANLSIGGNGDSGTYAGSISGIGDISKVGAGRLVLSGSDTYTGSTTVEAGTLTITAASALPSGTSLTIEAGGTFIFDPAAAGAPIASSAGSASAVPEPGTLVLLVAALATACGYYWRKRRS